ncbi:hypothetical protein COT98_01240 [Candidatus Falkowbacteria bacterium CG10_big_fil_rev_8_21_14_0_10_39_9]|uniref:Multidrug resistance protein MdtA-like barrel-sandwich hybrid domain-containing protein n=1 Tax=Candidatus Falkowbacteria bacterium CG10_big_fil_rev_8_21_14_0_10_39_9 TaxID=1974566 RepID=A0A2M6WQQ9_9BACT|nr:MAG: hypothetical protein COT98_01240 [Candidatus Falkowbacteria bacterium CG10_big_fil_rev_8_21_14_0_10_39_9]
MLLKLIKLMETSSSSRLKFNFFRFFGSHKIITIIIALALVGGSYYFYWQKTNASTVTRYVLTKVERGMISTSISGSGQISSSNQVEVKPKVSGDVVSLNIKIGQEVKAGDILAQLNTKDAQKTIRDAQINLQSAQLSLTKLKWGSLPEEIISGTNKVETAKKI